ncbi:hypothetical protein LYSHEL_08400 [Lysobacter helvus]|uniref:Uncharacterized protein n=2 Tax=Lysobacteraceae TaxID=32033 RepID=A0ABM7Q3K8_9GAMM|nr:hypothetical protein LYSCAS_08400 [Lysobacter caseinilyticus]BCT94969.1 hypothetical protein LYSHEL_08400 [Lysobacter helvus]
MLAAKDGEAAERDWLGVQCAIRPGAAVRQPLTDPVRGTTPTQRRNAQVAKRFDVMRVIGP